MYKESLDVKQIYGPLVLVGSAYGAKYNEIVELVSNGKSRLGRVLEVESEFALIQLFESSIGLTPQNTKVKFLGKSVELPVSLDMLGRIFDAFGRPRDAGPPILPEKKIDINGNPINPCAREYPSEFIQTGISAIDGLNTLVGGQKLPIFSGFGLPHAQLVAQIARQARVLGEEEEFAVVFAAIGITFEEANFFINSFKESGAIKNSVLFINLADDPAIERIATPRAALTCAEYLAFEKDMHVLVILTDMTNYCESLREISAARKEVPGRRGYPGYLYTDLATIYERTGRLKGKKGSITSMPILSMPEDDKTHPIPDLTGYITEGQIVLDRGLHRKGIYPPIDVLASLSRLRDKGIGEKKTREDHPSWTAQLFSSYARGKEIQELALVLGEGALSETDKVFLKFVDVFEDKFLRQGIYENRDIFTTLEIGYEIMRMIPRPELKRLKTEYIEKYMDTIKDTEIKK